MLESLFTRNEREIKPGLGRMLKLVAYLDLKAKTHDVLIGGTNGKGSTAYFLYQMLVIAGHNVSLYTSPHLFSLAERFIRSDLEVTLGDLEKVYLQVEHCCPRDFFENLSFFEVLTAMALVLFDDVPFRIFEVGLGGRFDATNIVEPQVSIICSLGFDHCDRLGNTLKEILVQKLGIARRGKALLVPDFRNDELNNIVDQSGAVVYRCSPSPVFSFPYGQNLSLALQAFQYCTGQVFPEGSLSRLHLPRARAERFVLANGMEVYVDVGHNEEAIEAVCDYIKVKIDVAMLCVMEGKPRQAMINVLKKRGIEVLEFKIDHERCLNDERMTLEELWSRLKDKAQLKVLVCGSFFALERVYKLLHLH